MDFLINLLLVFLILKHFFTTYFLEMGEKLDFKYGLSYYK